MEHSDSNAVELVREQRAGSFNSELTLTFLLKLLTAHVDMSGDFFRRRGREDPSQPCSPRGHRGELVFLVLLTGGMCVTTCVYVCCPPTALPLALEKTHQPQQQGREAARAAAGRQRAAPQVPVPQISGPGGATEQD